MALKKKAGSGKAASRKVRPKARTKSKPKPKAKTSAKAGKKSARVSARRAVKKPSGDKEMMLEKIGEVTHYFPHVNAAAVKLSKSGLSVGDSIYIKGHTTDFKENVASIQLDHVSISCGKKGQEIGLLVRSRVRIGDTVYKV